MGRWDTVLHLVLVWLTANVAVVAYLTFVSYARDFSRRLNAIASQEPRAQRIAALTIDRTHVPQPSRGGF
jgi:hypothetical protein